MIAHTQVYLNDLSGALATSAAVAEGEAILNNGAVSHSHLWFYRYAIEASLNDAAWTETERYAAALEDYTRPEQLPWAEFFISLGRALAAHGRDRHNHSAVSELYRLRNEATRFNLRTALPMIERGLAES